MSLREISLAQLLESTSGTEYFLTFAKLIGNSSNAIFYEGIGDDEYDLLTELEEKLDYEIPNNYIEFLSYLNGGRFLNTNLFSLDDKQNHNSLYARNFLTNIREELNLDDSILIVGNFGNYIMYIDCAYDDGSYSLMDIRSKEKMDFENISSLIGFIFYVLVINENKKTIKEKEEIEKAKEKLHNEIKLKEKERKKLVQKNKDKIRAKTAGKALKEALKKGKR